MGRKKVHVVLALWTLINLVLTVVLIFQNQTGSIASFSSGSCPGGRVERYSISEGDLIRYARDMEQAEKNTESEKKAREQGIAMGCSIGKQGALYR